MVRNPVTAQAPINKAGEPTSRAISAETMKIPEPIMDPVTSMVELVRPRPLTNSGEEESFVLTRPGFVSALNHPPLCLCRGRCLPLHELFDTLPCTISAPKTLP